MNGEITQPPRDQHVVPAASSSEEEDKNTASHEPVPLDLLKSRFDELSLPRTVWVFRRVIGFCLLLYTGYVCEGFELGAGGSIVANAGFIAQFGSRDAEGVRALDPTWVSTWSALLNVGQLLTFTHIAWVADRYGRKASFYVSWLWLALGCALLNVARTPQVWALAKLANGAGIGVLQVTCQVYVMEVVPNRIRGGMVTFQAVWSNAGGIVTAVMMQRLNAARPHDFRTPLRVLWGPVAAMLLCWAALPESPWFHARRRQKDRALRCMRRLYGGVEGYDFEEEYAIIERTIALECDAAGRAPSYTDVFRGTNRRRTLSVALLSACQQLAGLAVISTYSTYFLSLAGVDDPFLGTVFLSCCNLLAVLLWSFSTDKLGRRTIANIAQTACCAILFVVGGLFYTGASAGNAGAATALLAVCCLWSFTIQLVIMSYYLYSAELPSALLRVKTGPFTFFVNSVLGVAVCYATPPMLLSLDLRTGFVFAAFSVPLCVLTWLFLPETTGRSAAEIDELYERGIPAWRWSETVTEAEETMRDAVEVKGHV